MKQTVPWIRRILDRGRSFWLRLRIVYWKFRLTGGDDRLIAESTRDQPYLRHIKNKHDLIGFIFDTETRRQKINREVLAERRLLWLAKKLHQSDIQA